MCPVYCAAFVAAVISRGVSLFEVTPRQSDKTTSFVILLPQIFVAMVCLVASCIGIYNAITKSDARFAMATCALWCILVAATYITGFHMVFFEERSSNRQP